MDSYREAIRPLISHPIVKNWPELQVVMKRAAAREPISWKLPILASQSVGGNAEKVLPAVTAFTCVHMSILLIDDLLDEDPRGEHKRIGVGRAANLAVALSALASSALLDEGKDGRSELACKALADMQVVLSHGQDLDVQNQASEIAYWQVTKGKSAVFFGTALFLGALFGGENLDLAHKLRDFGEIYGEMMQIHDDLNDCLATPANPDWIQGRYPLPILFAEIVEHPDRERFIDLRKRAVEVTALEEAQAILVRCGAISYCVNELVARHARAQGLLNAMRLPYPKPMQTLLDEVIAPVENLFATIDSAGTASSA